MAVVITYLKILKVTSIKPYFTKRTEHLKSRISYLDEMFGFVFLEVFRLLNICRKLVVSFVLYKLKTLIYQRF